MTLLQAGRNKQVTVQGLDCAGVCRQRLMDLGVFKGTKLVVVGVAPLGDPMIIEIDNCKIAIRKVDAAKILVV